MNNILAWAVFFAFAWTLLAFLAGVFTHWWATRRQRALLKAYEERERAQTTYQRSDRWLRNRWR